MSDGTTTNRYGADLWALSWSPDGTRLVGTLPPAGIVVMSASGGGATTIRQRDAGARWSPSSDEIAIEPTVVAPDGMFLREIGLQNALDWSTRRPVHTRQRPAWRHRGRRGRLPHRPHGGRRFAHPLSHVVTGRREIVVYSHP